MNSKKFVIEQPSRYGFDKTVELLVVEAELRECNSLWQNPEKLLNLSG
jgi:hypothetical protein